MVDDKRSHGDTLKEADANSLYYFDLNRVIPFLAQNALSIALGALFGAALGLTYLLVTSPTNTVQAQLLIDPSLTRVLRDHALEQPLAMDSQQVETELAILRSEEISRSVIKALDLANEPEFSVKLLSDYVPSGWLSAESQSAADTSRANKLLQNFQKNLTIRRIGVSYAIDILYSAKNPDLAARIANGVADAYMKFQVDTRTKAAETGSEWLKGRLNDLRLSMNDSARKLQEQRASQDYSISKVAASRGDASASASGQTTRSSLDELQSAAATNRQVYDSFLQTYVATVQRQSFPLANAKIITTASGSLAQSRNPIMVLAFWTLMGAAVVSAAKWFQIPLRLLAVKPWIEGRAIPGARDGPMPNRSETC